MQVLERNAAAILFEKANDLDKKPHNSWRCIYINVSAHRMRHNHGLLAHFVGKAVRELLTDAEGYIYLCHDGDIFILFQGTLKSVTSKLGEHFGEMQLDENGQPEDSMFTILDLSKDWDVFFKLCRTKSRQQVPIWAETPMPFAYSDKKASNELALQKS